MVSRLRGAAAADANLHSTVGTPDSARRLSGGELRQLLEHRRRLRDEIVALPRVGQREVLGAIEESRRYRLSGTQAARTPPEMSRAELIRRLKWRIDAAGLEESAAGVRALDRAKRAHAVTLQRLSHRGTGRR